MNQLSPTATFGNVDDLFANLRPDPEAPTEGEAADTAMM